MAATLCARLIPKQGWHPLAQSVRHSSKAVTRHRKPIHILRQKLLAVTKYIPPPRPIPPGAYPAEKVQVQEDTPLTLMMKKKLKTLFEECKMIAVVQENAIHSEDLMTLKGRLHKHGIEMKYFSNALMRSALQDGHYRNLLPLFVGSTVLFVSKEPKVKEMLTALRSSPQMILLGACVDHTLLSVEGLLRYSRLPSVTVVQGQLVSGLTAMTSRTAALLQHHPVHLSALLQQHVKQQSAAPEAPAGTAAQEAT